MVSWKSSLQYVMILSTTEVEYISLTEALKEAFWLKGIVGELGYEQKTITVFCDSQNSIYLTKNAMVFHGTNHINIRLHDRDIIVINNVSISLCLFSILLYIFLVLYLFLCFVGILDERIRKELKLSQNMKICEKQSVVRTVGWCCGQKMETF